MKKTLIKTLALVLALMMALSACGKPAEGSSAASSDSSEEGTASTSSAASEDEKTSSTDTEAPVTTGEEIKDLVLPRLQDRELETFNILYSQTGMDFEALSSMFDGLLEQNTKGELVPAIAEKWGTEDNGVTWTFNLREGVKWVDMNGNEKADCIAQDFATALEWVLNFYKNDSANTSMPTELIKGATEYYEYTKNLDKAEAVALTAESGSKFMETVGIEIPDDYTVVYTCLAEIPYFDTVAANNCLYPMSAAMIEELGGVDKVAGMNNTNVWYNGCYTMTSFIQKNEKIFTKNPLYWDTSATLFDTVTYKMVDSMDVAFQLYQTGEVDYVQLTESNLSTISSDPNNEYYNYLVPDVPSKYSYQFHFNYNKNKEDGTVDTNWNTAIANTAFRQAWYYGLDLTNYWKRTNMLEPLACENNFYTMKGLVYTSDGTDYTELVRQELGLAEIDGKTIARLDTAKAAEFKAQAMEELTALGVTFPVEIDHYISASSSTALDTANVLKQLFSDSLGDDFVKLNIKTYVSSPKKEVYDPSLHSIAINGWGADYGDPQNYLGQETYLYDNAYYSANHSKINSVTEETDTNKDLLAAYKEYTALVEAANAITGDLDARYAAYAKAEAYMLENVLVLPCSYSVGWALSKVDNSSKINGMYGAQNDKMKNWATNANGYTTEEAAALAAAK